jgi:sialic acid synthase SpsE
VFRGDNHQDFLRLYETTDMHFGNRVHAHLKCLSLGVASFCTPFDLRQAYFAESLDFPLVQKVPDPILSQYDFTRARARRDAARGTMDLFTTRLKSLIAS